MVHDPPRVALATARELPELEVTEPSLFLSHDAGTHYEPGAAERLTRAIVARLAR
jgi:hypothetical protein